MVKPISEYGGWLRFFRLVQSAWVLFTVVTLAFIIFSYTTKGASGASWDLFRLETTIATVVLISITLKIVFAVKKPHPHIPTLIATLLILSAIFSIAGSIVSIEFSDTRVKLNPLNDIARPILMTAIWVVYFRFSKRVRSFYGANAFSGQLQRTRHPAA
jgi:hypothetical protein